MLPLRIRPRRLTSGLVNDPPSEVVLVTGASSGIGAATARHLAQDGHHVVAVARRGDRIAELAVDIRGRRGFGHRLHRRCHGPPITEGLRLEVDRSIRSRPFRRA